MVGSDIIDKPLYDASWHFLNIINVFQLSNGFFKILVYITEGIFGGVALGWRDFVVTGLWGGGALWWRDVWLRGLWV